MTTADSGAISPLPRSVFRWCLGLLMSWTLALFLLEFLAKLMPLFLLFVFTAPIALLVLIAAAVAWARSNAPPRRWIGLGVLLLWPLLVWHMLVTSWPMTLSFVLSKPALNRLADDVAANRVPALPKRAGAYVIHAVETRSAAQGPNGVTVCLWMPPLQRQHVGFVRSPLGVTPDFNPWTHRQMDASWHYFGED